MVASSMSIAMANTVLNTIVADVLCEMADELEKADNFELAVHDLIKKTVTDHYRIVFNGNGYSEEWVKEAEKRGLPNIKNMVEAIPALTTKKAMDIFGKHHVFSPVELHSRAEVLYESYSKAINIEAKTMISMASVQYIPAVITYTKELADSINAVKAAVPDVDVQVQADLLKKTSLLLKEANSALKKLEDTVGKANTMEEGAAKAAAFRDLVIPAMEDLRKPIDQLELIVDHKLWPVPTYGDLLFEV
jgi:glutamine synthetase